MPYYSLTAISFYTANAHICFTFSHALISLDAVNLTPSCLRCLFQVFLWHTVLIPIREPFTLTYDCPLAYFSKENEKPSASPLHHFMWYLTKDQANHYSLKGSVSFEGERILAGSLERKRGSVQKARKGSDLGQVESPDAELCSVAGQPNHTGMVPLTASEVGQRKRGGDLGEKPCQSSKKVTCLLQWGIPHLGRRLLRKRVSPMT